MPPDSRLRLSTGLTRHASLIIILSARYPVLKNILEPYLGEVKFTEAHVREVLATAIARNAGLPQQPKAAKRIIRKVMGELVKSVALDLEAVV